MTKKNKTRQLSVFKEAKKVGDPTERIAIGYLYIVYKST